MCGANTGKFRTLEQQADENFEICIFTVVKTANQPLETVNIVDLAIHELLKLIKLMFLVVCIGLFSGDHEACVPIKLSQQLIFSLRQPTLTYLATISCLYCPILSMCLIKLDLLRRLRHVDVLVESTVRQVGLLLSVATKLKQRVRHGLVRPTQDVSQATRQVLLMLSE